MTATTSRPTHRRLLNECLDLLARAIQRAGGNKVVAELVSNPNNDAAEILWWKSGVLASAPTAKVWVGVAREQWRLLASASGLRASEDAESDYASFLNQSWSCAGELAAGAPPEGPWQTVRIVRPGDEPIHFFLAFAWGAEEQSVRSDMSESALGVLLDIELPVTLRFGRTKMLLHDVLTLNTGSVVEFDRQVQEPIEVLVNGHVVARGEAVTVKGNYAVRISEIVNLRQRLDSGAGLGRSGQELA